MATTTTRIQEYLKKNELSVGDTIALEVLLAEKFIEVNNLHPLDGSYIKNILGTAQGNVGKSIFANIDVISVDDLVSSFEVLVPSAEAKEYGAFFTPEAITSFMAKELVASLETNGFDLKNVKILDPAVGCGALLIAVANVLAQKTGLSFAHCASQLTGTDLSANSIQRAHLLFELVSLKQGDTTIPTPNLRVESGLLKNNEVFEGVIANPPYVRFQMMNDDLRDELKLDWESCSSGNYNLYFAFVEKANLSLVENGTAYFITPNGFINSKSGVGLRKWIEKTKTLSHVIDFDKNKVFQVMTYTAITVFEKSLQKNITYEKAANAAALSTHTYQDKAIYDYARLAGGNSWEFVDSKDDSIVNTVSSYPVALTDVFDIRYGLATLRDKIFTFRSSLIDGFYALNHDGIDYLIEKDLVKKCIKVSGLKSEADIAADDLKIIYPYTVDNGKAVPMTEAFVKSNFPEGFKYLLSVKDELAKRDKGHKTYPEWFSYGRTQGLIPYKTKLLTPLYLIQPRFMHDDTESLFINGCALIPKPNSGMSLEDAQKFLNSNVVRDFMLATSNPIDGGFVAYQKSQLSRINMPKTS